MFSRFQISLRKITFATLLSVIGLVNPYGMEFTFEHGDCKIRVKNYEDSELEKLSSMAKEKLKGKNFEIQDFIENSRLLAGDLYFDLEVVRPKDHIYTACIVNIVLAKAKGNTPRKSDEILYKKSIRRRVPRITFSGSERCRMALQDAFVHIPYCRPIGYAGEKK